MREQDMPLFPLEAQELVLFGHVTSDLVGGNSLEETETASQQIDDRTVRHGTAVGSASCFQHLIGFDLESAQELVEQAGLAHARIAHEHGNRALPVDGPAVDFGETLELSIAAGERCQLALSRYFQPGSAAELPAHGIDANGLGLPFDLELAQVLEHEESVPKGLCSSTGYDLAWLGDREESGREVGGVADRRVVHAEVAADGADNHGTCIEPHPHLEVDPVGPLHVLGERLEVVLD